MFIEMGQEAKEKFTNFASQINSNMKQVDKNVRENTNERRSLLDSNDDEEEELLFAISSDRSNEMEMRAIGSKKHD